MEDHEWKNRVVRHGVIDVDQILFNENNWRIHPRDQQTAVGGILDDVGWVAEVTINLRTSPEWGADQNVETLVDGHMRAQVAMRNGQKQVPVKYVDLSPAEEALVLASLDPIAALAKTDKIKLEALMQKTNTGSDAMQTFLSDLAQKEKLDSINQPKVGDETEVDDIEKVSGELPGVQSLKDVKVFPSKAKYDMPDLLPDMLMEIPEPIQVWVGDKVGGIPVEYDPDIPNYMFMWGRDASRGLNMQQALISFYVDDFRFESFWNDPAEYTGKLLNSHVMGAMMPNYSMWWDMPQVLRMWQRYRSLWVARYFQEAGIPVIPDVQLSYQDGEICWLGIPQGCDIGMQFHTKMTDDANWEKKLEFAMEVVDAIQPRKILAYVQPNKVDDLLAMPFADKLVMVNTHAYQRKLALDIAKNKGKNTV